MCPRKPQSLKAPFTAKEAGSCLTLLISSNHVELGRLWKSRRYETFVIPRQAQESSLTSPQLVIVGGQSSGKSSLLQSLTDIPFPVGTDCCTRFATRIVSRRTAPGTPNKVTITVVPPDFKKDNFDYPPNNTYQKKNQTKETHTTEENTKDKEEDRVPYRSAP